MRTYLLLFIIFASSIDSFSCKKQKERIDILYLSIDKLDYTLFNLITTKECANSHLVYIEDITESIKRIDEIIINMEDILDNKDLKLSRKKALQLYEYINTTKKLSLLLKFQKYRTLHDEKNTIFPSGIAYASFYETFHSTLKEYSSHSSYIKAIFRKKHLKK
nr:hypothetical protein [uncultured Carboxylicivirga sp.]